MAAPARRRRVLRGELEVGVRLVVELEVLLPRALRVTGLAAAGDLGEPHAVLVVLGVAGIAARGRLALAQRLGVAVVARDLRVLAGDRVAGLLLVIEAHLLHR